MSGPQLRLAFSEFDHEVPAGPEVTRTGASGLHIHLHLGAPLHASASVAPQPGPASESVGGNRHWRLLLLGAAALLIAGSAFEFGARTGEGHARAVASVGDPGAAPASLASMPAALAAAGEMPPALRQQLSQPPVVTPPAGNDPAGATHAFGLHP
jgi:hypothetical protein